MSSKHLNERQIKAINRLGDCLIPGDPGLPAFSETTAVTDVDRILDYMPSSDLNDLKTLLTLLSYFPKVMLGLLLRFLELSPHIPTPVGALLRFMRLGLRGLIMTLYYSNAKAHDVLGYNVSVYTADLEKSH